MLAKLTNPLQVLTHLRISHRRRDTAEIIAPLRLMPHMCPCCSDILLRHMRLGGLYWRCCTCRQEMPV